jgi:hypothetical protein
MVLEYLPTKPCHKNGVNVGKYCIYGASLGNLEGNNNSQYV